MHYMYLNNPATCLTWPNLTSPDPTAQLCLTKPRNSTWPNRTLQLSLTYANLANCFSGHVTPAEWALLSLSSSGSGSDSGSERDVVSLLLQERQVLQQVGSRALQMAVRAAAAARWCEALNRLTKFDANLLQRQSLITIFSMIYHQLPVLL